MKNLLILTIMLAAAAVAVSATKGGAIIPAKITKEDQSGKIFERPDMERTERENGNVTLDVTTLLSSDKKFASGMYQAGKSYWEAKDAYGVDEFMYFLEGGVKLTSSDGTVQMINAGEAVTIPKEWTGIWETDGYTKIWVIYSDDGSAFK